MTNKGKYSPTGSKQLGGTLRMLAVNMLVVFGATCLARADLITLKSQQPGGNDWETAGAWSDGKAASASSAANPTNVYEVLAGARLRSPGTAEATFPGATLIVSGDSVPVIPSGATTSEIRFKQASDMGTVTFPMLVMNGGQLDLGNDGTVVILGQIKIATNSTFYNDGPNDRGFQIDAKLSGAGTITFMQNATTNTFNANYTRCLNINGEGNTFTGKWNVLVGPLLGSTAGSLGTNDIFVGANGALETMYDINSPKATLTLNGRMYLHQDVSFGYAIVNGKPLNKGKYTFEQLNATYPTTFPATWTAILGSYFGEGSGSLTVLNEPSGVTVGKITPAAGSTDVAPTTTIAVEMQDGAAISVVTNTIVLKVNGTVVTPSIAKTAKQVVVSYSPTSLFAPLSTNTAEILFSDSNGSSTNQVWSFTVMSGGTLLPANAVQSVDKSKPGFLARPFETDQVQPGTIAWTEELLLGQHGPNLADLSGADANGYYTVDTVINWDKTAGSVDHGRFVSPDYPDVVMPGFPGTGPNGFDYGAEEILTYLDFPSAGLYTMVVNSDDGFKVTSGKAAKDVFGAVLGIYNGGRASADSPFTVQVPQAGVYPFRLVWENGTGDANLEWFLVQPDGTRALINDTTNSIKAYRSASLPVYVSQLSHGVNATGLTPNANIVIQFTDGANASLDSASVKLTLNGATLTPTVRKSGSITTVTWPSTGLLPTGTNNAVLEYADTATPSVKTTNAWSFMVMSYGASSPKPILIAGVQNAPWINVVYDQTVDPASAANTANYKLSSGTVDTAVLTSNGRTVVLGVSGVTASSVNLTINGVKDLIGRATTSLVVPVSMNGIAVNFQTGTTETPEGYIADTGPVYGDRGDGHTYGWDVDNTASSRQRNNASSYDLRYDTFTHMMKPAPAGSFWEIGVTNGDFQVYVVAGESDNFDETLKIKAEGVMVVDTVATTAVRWADGVATVTVKDGRLTIGNDTAALNNKIAFLHIYPAPKQEFNGKFDKIIKEGSDAVITWQGNGVLQVSDDIKGTWKDVSAATSPYRTPIGTAAKQFFRLRNP